MTLFLPKKKIPETTQVRVAGEMVSVTVRTSARARNYRLAIPHHGGPVLTVPDHGRWSEAEAFLNRQTAWLEARLKRSGRPVAFAQGAVVPLRGVDHTIMATGKARGRVERIEGQGIEGQHIEGQHIEGQHMAVLMVPGETEHRARRLIDWLKTEAQRDLEARVLIHAGTLGVTVKSVSTRSQATRWGSCSSSGNLNFNWRLVLAPPFVLDYVAAHEVAHLREMNHSQAFWDRVTEALPDMSRGRAWLKAHGRQLMAYGVDARPRKGTPV